MTTVANSRTLLASGATSGSGQATALLVLESGHPVVGVGRSPAPEDLTHEHYTHVRPNVSMPSAGGDLARQLPEPTWESIDGLVNGAAVDIGVKTGFGQMAPEHIVQTIQTNLLGLPLFTRAMMTTLLIRPLADTVNIITQSVLDPSPGLSNYAASERGVHGLTVALRKELAKTSVRTEVKPGIVRTSFSARRVASSTRPVGRLTTTRSDPSCRPATTRRRSFTASSSRAIATFPTSRSCLTSPPDQQLPRQPGPKERDDAAYPIL